MSHRATPKLPPTKQRIPLLLARLEATHPKTGTALHFADPVQLAVATILSAQCTDQRVNQVTPALFARFPTAHDFANANLSEIQQLVKSINFFRNKAKYIQELCRILIARHGGQIPRTLEELVQLPGIGRKTANVILGDAFGVPGITVDTHVGRLSRRLGLTTHTDPVKVERDLMRLVPQPEWTRFSHRLILHGRQVCAARKPRCADCRLAELCPRRGIASSKSKMAAPPTT
jgi:endonuclease-3